MYCPPGRVAGRWWWLVWRDVAWRDGTKQQQAREASPERARGMTRQRASSSWDDAAAGAPAIPWSGGTWQQQAREASPERARGMTQQQASSSWGAAARPWSGGTWQQQARERSDRLWGLNEAGGPGAEGSAIVPYRSDEDWEIDLLLAHRAGLLLRIPDAHIFETKDEDLARHEELEAAQLQRPYVVWCADEVAHGVGCEPWPFCLLCGRWCNSD